MNAVFIVCIQAVTHAHRDDRKCPQSIFLSLTPAVCVCVCRPNCVQVLPRWFQMTQEKPVRLLGVLEECGYDVERERVTSPSLFVCSLTFRVLCSPSQFSSFVCCLVCRRVTSENCNCNYIAHHWVCAFLCNSWWVMQCCSSTRLQPFDPSVGPFKELSADHFIWINCNLKTTTAKRQHSYCVCLPGCSRFTSDSKMTVMLWSSNQWIWTYQVGLFFVVNYFILQI